MDNIFNSQPHISKNNFNIYFMKKVIVRRKKISQKNECLLGNPTPGNLDGTPGSADLWTNVTNNKKKKE